MKRQRSSLCAVLLLACLAASLPAEVRVAPYYSLRFTEGVSAPSVGDWQNSASLSGDMGLIVQPAEAHKFLGYYQLKFTGPGFQSTESGRHVPEQRSRPEQRPRTEGEQFSDRTMDHVAVLRYQYSFPDGYALKTQFDYLNEYKRTGSNETWSTGLYDFTRTGGGVMFSRRFSPALSSEISLQYHRVVYPNYTDLLAETKLAPGIDDVVEGKQNQKVYQAGLTTSLGAARLFVEYQQSDYERQKTIVDTVQTNGSYYSSDLQRDTVLTGDVRYSQKVGSFAVLDPSATYRMKRSNQNYQYFNPENDQEPPRFMARYYDYNQLNVALPLTVFMGTRWEYFLSPEFEQKAYTSRGARDAGGSFLSGKQNNSVLLLGTGFTYKPNAITRTTFFYTYQKSSSNTKFEKYLPYNYTGHFFGVSVGYTY